MYCYVIYQMGTKNTYAVCKLCHLKFQTTTLVMLYIVRFIYGQHGYIKGPYLGASRQDQATLAKSRLQHHAKTLYIPLLINIAIQIPAGPPELAQSQIKSGEPGAKQINSRTTSSEGLKGLLTCLLVPMDPEAVRCTG